MRAVESQGSTVCEQEDPAAEQSRAAQMEWGLKRTTDPHVHLSINNANQIEFIAGLVNQIKLNQVL